MEEKDSIGAILVYNATKQQFIDNVRANAIDDAIENEVARKLNRNPPMGGNCTMTVYMEE